MHWYLAVVQTSGTTFGLRLIFGLNLTIRELLVTIFNIDRANGSRLLRRFHSFVNSWN